MEACLEKSRRHRRVQKIRRDDGHEINALVLRQRGFSFGHFLVAAINALGVQKKLLARHRRVFRVGRERARHQFDLTVEIGGQRCTAPMKAFCPPPTMP